MQSNCIIERTISGRGYSDIVEIPDVSQKSSQIKANVSERIIRNAVYDAAVSCRECSFNPAELCDLGKALGAFVVTENRRYTGVGAVDGGENVEVIVECGVK